MSEEQILTYSNPRLSATFDDWPMGSSKRGTCRFTIESSPRLGQRVVRQTTCNGRPAKPKTNTFSRRACIVDGSDGKTYILRDVAYGFVSVSKSDLRDQESVYPRTDPDRYKALMSLIDQAK